MSKQANSCPYNLIRRSIGRMCPRERENAVENGRLFLPALLLQLLLAGNYFPSTGKGGLLSKETELKRPYIQGHLAETGKSEL